MTADPTIRFQALPTALVRALQTGAPDANGQAPERHISDGQGVPCRHCLQDVAAGAPYLILAHRPFPKPQPYAEIGPIFLHAEACPRHPESAELPAPLARRPRHLVKAYRADDRIYYGKGEIVAPDQLVALARKLLADPEIAYLHVRSALNNCFTCRIDRA